MDLNTKYTTVSQSTQTWNLKLYVSLLKSRWSKLQRPGPTKRNIKLTRAYKKACWLSVKIFPCPMTNEMKVKLRISMIVATRVNNPRTRQSPPRSSAAFPTYGITDGNGTWRSASHGT